MDLLESQLELRLQTGSRKAASGGELSLDYTLINRSARSVCVGAGSELVGGPSRIDPHEACRTPGLVAPAGGSVRWSESWASLWCYEEEDVDPEHREMLAGWICGAERSVRARINVYELRRGKRQPGAVWVESEPTVVELVSREKNFQR